MAKSLLLKAFAAAFAVAMLFGCATVPADAIRVGTYNIRLSAPTVEKADGANYWSHRKADMVELVRKMDLDVFGLQEVCPDQAQYLREQLTEFEFVGEHRNADRVTGEASPVCYRRSRFDELKKGTFWLSETPDTPGLKGWGAACPRVCSYLVLREKTSGRVFCFANCHTDHISELAREKGMLLIIERMKDFGAGSPIVFTGDHNCRYDDAPAKAVRQVLKDARDVTETPVAGPRNTFQGFGKFKDGPVDENGKRYKDCCIDYIYVSDGTRVLDFATHDDRRPGTDLYPSDHYPVTATVVLP